MSLQSLIFPLNKKGEVWQALPFRFLPFLAWRNLPFAEAIDSNSEIFTAGPISGLAQAETGVRFPLGAPISVMASGPRDAPSVSSPRACVKLLNVPTLVIGNVLVVGNHDLAPALLGFAEH